MVMEPVVKEREKWGNKVDFLLSCLGYAVGLGNVWRFPYLCGRNGGAAFLVPYFLVMIFAGFPVFYLELALGQYSSQAQHIIYRRMSPIFSGIGYCMLAVSLYTAIYYNMIIAWALHYFAASFKGIFGTLPWSACNNAWNTMKCFDDKKANECWSKNSITPVYYKGECLNVTMAETTLITFKNATMSIAQFANGTLRQRDERETAAQEYNKYSVLNEADSIEGIGWPKGDLVFALVVAWILVFFCLIKGVKSSGKVVYFTATFPYLLLIILCIRGNMLDGAGDGIDFFINPDWSSLANSQPWIDAAQQIFFSLSLGGGGLTTLASYNKFNNNIMRDTLIVVIGNAATSMLAGFTIFPIIGHIAKAVYPLEDPRERVAQFAKDGPTLAFIAYPDALERLPVPWFWCMLFFFMLILLGIDTQLVMVDVLITAITDQFPHLRKFKKRICVVIGVCLVSLVGGLILTTPIGTYVLTLLDTYAGGIPLLIACLIEVMMVAYVYGYRRFISNITEMLGKPKNNFWKWLGYPVNPYWWVCWIALTPALLFASLVANFVIYSRTTMGNYVFPIWAEVVGWLTVLSCLGWIPAIALYRICTTPRSHWYELTQPTDDWGPSTEVRNAAVIGRNRLSRNGLELKDLSHDNKSNVSCHSPTKFTGAFARSSSVQPSDSESLRKNQGGIPFDESPLLDIVDDLHLRHN